MGAVDKVTLPFVDLSLCKDSSAEVPGRAGCGAEPRDLSRNTDFNKIISFKIKCLYFIRGE
jgi:hypothetical protein